MQMIIIRGEYGLDEGLPRFSASDAALNIQEVLAAEAKQLGQDQKLGLIQVGNQGVHRSVK